LARDLASHFFGDTAPTTSLELPDAEVDDIEHIVDEMEEDQDESDEEEAESEGDIDPSAMIPVQLSFLKTPMC